MRYGTFLKTSPLWSRVIAYIPIPTDIVPMCNIIQICWISIYLSYYQLKNYIFLIKMYKFFLWSGTQKHCIICCWHMCSWVLTTVHNVKPVACNDKVTGTAFLYMALYLWCQNIYIHLFVVMICILWLHCIYFLYRHSSSTTYMYTLLLSVKEECCRRYLHGYCTSHPVRMNFENFNGGSSTVSAVSSKIPYQGSSNHFNLFLKVISCQCKFQLYIYV